MLQVKTDESFWNYSGQENFLVIPITSYIRKDGNLVLVSDEGKEAATQFQDLQKVWGYLVGRGVPLPTLRRRGVNLVGVMDREHYASNPNKDFLETSLYLLREMSESNPNYLFYLLGPLGGKGFEELNSRILNTDRFISLERTVNVET